jgi:hypothetical protein
MPNGKEILNEISYSNEIKELKAKGELDLWTAQKVYDMVLKCDYLEARSRRNATNIFRLTIAVIVLTCTTGGGAFSIIKILGG